MDNEAKHGDTDAGVSHVERRPGMGQRDVQVEKQKVDHVAMHEPIGQVPENAGKQEREGNITPGVARMRTEQKGEDKDKCGEGKGDEEQVVVPE